MGPAIEGQANHLPKPSAVLTRSCYGNEGEPICHSLLTQQQGLYCHPYREDDGDGLDGRALVIRKSRSDLSLWL